MNGKRESALDKTGVLETCYVSSTQEKLLMNLIDSGGFPLQILIGHVKYRILFPSIIYNAN